MEMPEIIWDSHNVQAVLENGLRGYPGRGDQRSEIRDQRRESPPAGGFGRNLPRISSVLDLRFLISDL